MRFGLIHLNRPLKSFCNLIMEALMAELPDHGPSSRETPVQREKMDWASWTEERRDHYLPCVPPQKGLLPGRCVLAKLLGVQSLGDVDFERLYLAYDQLVARFLDDSLPYDRMRWTHPEMTADWLTDENGTSDSVVDDVRLVQRYRISSTTRDCSIMITFQRMTTNE